MQDIVEQPSERDEAIYAACESGKSLRVLARDFETSVMEIERAIDRVLPPFTTQNQMRAYKRELGISARSITRSRWLMTQALRWPTFLRGSTNAVVQWPDGRASTCASIHSACRRNSNHHNTSKSRRLFSD